MQTPLGIKLLVTLFVPVVFGALLVYGLSLLGFTRQTLFYAPPAEIQEVKGDRLIGQTFVAALPGLHRIDVLLFDRGRRNTHDVTFHLREGPEASADIVSLTFNASEVRGREWVDFSFPPLPDSAGKTYYFYFSSPDSGDGDAIAVGGIQVNLYPDGLAYLSSTPASADLAFRAGYAQVTLARKAGEFVHLLTADRPFPWNAPYFYVALTIVYVLLAAAVIWRLSSLGLDR